MDQKEYWNGPVAHRWVEFREINETVLAPPKEAALALAAPRPGERALDVGCGAGGTTIALAERVAPDGSVLGVDISEPMLAFTRERIAKAGVRAEVVVDDAATRAFHGDFDLVFSAFGVMFFPEPERAFANLRSALRPGGRMAFVCWRTLAEAAVMRVPFEAARDVLPASPPPDLHAPGPFALGHPARLRTILEGAGLRDVNISPLDPSLRLGATLDDAVAFAMQSGPLARALLEASDDLVSAARDRVRRALAAYETDAGVILPGAMWLVSALT
ncbi:MAG: methyltransferase domain-containing protein [Polyangiaceae bacterium]|nr:methyltransferase domain-containing protein [Polyangiaceae bacterium]